MRAHVSALHAPLAALLAACAAERPIVRAGLAEPAELQLFDFTDASAWRHTVVGPAAFLELHGRSDYRPPHRSPASIALLRGAEFGDFELSVRVRQTTEEYPHRDVIVVFAWRDPAHFAYVHLASRGDANAHHVMLVDGRDRHPVTTARTEGVAWGPPETWHEVRIVRRGRRVEAFFDGGAQAVLVGEVPSGAGRIGIGSFDDTAHFAQLRVRG